MRHHAAVPAAGLVTAACEGELYTATYRLEPGAVPRVRVTFDGDERAAEVDLPVLTETTARRLLFALVKGRRDALRSDVARRRSA